MSRVLRKRPVAAPAPPAPTPKRSRKSVRANQRLSPALVSPAKLQPHPHPHPHPHPLTLTHPPTLILTIALTCGPSGSRLRAESHHPTTRTSPIRSQVGVSVRVRMEQVDGGGDENRGAASSPAHPHPLTLIRSPSLTLLVRRSASPGRLTAQSTVPDAHCKHLGSSLRAAAAHAASRGGGGSSAGDAPDQLDALDFKSCAGSQARREGCTAHHR
jgi:hypothetical protein